MLKTRYLLLAPLLFWFSLAAASRQLPDDAASLPWSRGAFQGAPLEIRDAARRLVAPSETGVVILLDESVVVLDESSRIRQTRHLLYRIGQEQPGEWATITAVWPRRQARPEVRARVVTSDGREVQLDQSALAEAPLRETGQNIFGDTRVLRAPLPALGPGAVVEIQFVLRDNEPMFPQGIAAAFQFGRDVPVLRSVLTIEAPEKMPLQYGLHRLPQMKPAREASGGIVKWTFESARTEPIDPVDVWLSDGGDLRLSYVTISTGVSWSDIASAYSAIVDRSIANSAVSDIVKDVIQGASGRHDIIERLLQKVQRTVRYAAVELGNADIVPTAPTETLRLEYGDCKDQAALLVAMMRSAGIESYVALLRASVGPEAEPALPGFGNFDHAIVYVPGDTPLWIDPTTRFSRAGQLPPQDEGRRALVAKPDSNALVRVSGAPVRQVDTIEVFLAEEGPGKMVVTTEFHGAAELLARLQHDELTKAEDLREEVADLADLLFDTRSVSDIERSDVTDFSKPFRIKYEAKGAGGASSEDGAASMAISIPGLIASTGILPIFSFDEKRIGESVVLSGTSATEWNYRISAPDGFRPLPLPEKRRIQMGPLVFSSEFSSAPNGAIAGTIRFEVPRRELSPKDFAEIKEQLDKLDETPQIEIAFQQIAAAHFEAGKFREGFAELRRLAALHPKESLHHRQIALQFLKKGMGEAARDAAKRGAEAEPGSAEAHAALGFVQEHDIVGRRWQKGFDLAAAKAAFQKALELDPDNLTIRTDYAYLLEHNDEGHEYGSGADIEEALRQYRIVHDKMDPASEARRNLPMAQLKAGKLADARTASTPSDIRLVAVAAADGSAAALREVNRLAPDAQARQKLLMQAVRVATESRHYEAAAAFLRPIATAPGAQASLLQQVERMAAMRRYEEKLPENTPAGVAQRFFMDSVVLGRTGEKIAPLLSKAGREELRRAPSGMSDIAALLAGRPALQGPSDEMLADMLGTLLSATAEGNDTLGYRVSIGLAAAGLGERLYVIREDGQYRVLTAGRSDLALAAGALERADRGELDAAKQWLDWAGDEIRQNRSELEFLADDAFSTAWLNTLRKDREGIRRAAAAMLASVPEKTSVTLPILTAARTATTGSVRQCMDQAYIVALLAAGRPEEALVAGRRLLQEKNPIVPVRSAVALTLLQLQRWDELKTLLKDESRAVDGAVKPEWVAAVALKRGDFDAAETALREGFPRGGPQIRLPWISLYRGRVTGDDLALAQRGTTRVLDPQPLKILAALYAETGKADEAIATTLQWMQASGMREPSGDVWYLVGRVMEDVGEIQSAAAAYKKVAAPKGFMDALDSAYPLAQKRLKTLPNP